MRISRNLGARLSALSVLASVLVVGLGPAAVSGAASHGQVFELYAGHGVEVVTSYNQATGCGGAFLTTDSSHWVNITPPKPGKVNGQCLYAWTSAWFTSPSDGWLVGQNGGSTNTILEHTLDAGKTWTTEPGGSTGSASGSEVVGFESATSGWRQQFATGSNAQYLLQHTSDAGTTWTTVHQKRRQECELLPDTFASNSIGFAAEVLVGATPGDNLVTASVWRTLNGGVSWTKFAPVSAPSSTSQGRLLYGAPSFNGKYGYMPVVIVLPHSSKEEIEFLRSKNYGRSWSPAGNSVVTGTLRFAPISGACGASSMISGPLVSVASANGAWWILRPGPKDASAVIHVKKGSMKEYKVTTTKGLPSTKYGATLQPANARDALVTIGNPSQPSALYATSDGGANWTVVTPSSVNG